MLLVQKAIHKHSFGGKTLNTSRLLSWTTIFVVLSLVLFAGVEIIIEMPQVAKLFRLPEEIIIHEPPKKKKFEILFDNDTDFVYMIQVKKPVVEPPKKLPPPPKPEPPKPKPKPKAKPQAAPKVAPVENAPVGDTQGQVGGASENTLMSELIAYVNRHKVYPRAAQRRGIQGINYITVSIEPNGRIKSASLAQGAGSATLDNASKKLAEKITSLKLSAPNKPLKISVPIHYTFKD